MKTTVESGKGIVMPTVEQLEAELNRTRGGRRGRGGGNGNGGGGRPRLLHVLSILIVAAAVAVLISTLLMPVLRIYGSSMEPTLRDGDVVAAVRVGSYERGDVIAFYYNNKILVKRVIGLPGEWIDIAADGTVTIDGDPLDEPYLSELARGEISIELPYQVPDGRYFVMGDHRNVSSDSRSEEIGCVAEEQIVGRLVFRLWPASRIGALE